MSRRTATRARALSLRTALACAASLVAASCCPNAVQRFSYQYVLVEYATGVSTASPPADVSSTPTFQDARGSLRAVTIRLPDTCLTQTANQATGVSASSNLILRSDCAVWLAELERALTGAGYRVISWDALLRLERTRNLSTYVAAQELGADAVYVINSLETGATQPGGRAGARLHYFESNPRGERLRPVALGTQQRAVLRTFTMNRTGTPEVTQVSSLSATLDVTAIIARTGESVWFYRRSVVRRLGGAGNVKLLYMGSNLLWRPVAPDLPVVQDVQQDQLSTRDEVREELGPQQADPHQAERLALVRTVVGDFVTRFRGQGG